MSLEPFLGEIMPVGFNFAPRGWALCSGQLLPISQNTALFSLLGTTYGGNGTSNFALPNLNGRVPIGFGQGPGLTPRDLGEQAGAETVTLNPAEMPAHQHAMPGGGEQTSTRPGGSAAGGHYGQPGGGQMAPPSPAGGSQPHQNMQPYLVVNYVIAVQGVYPSRP